MDETKAEFNQDDPLKWAEAQISFLKVLEDYRVLHRSHMNNTSSKPAFIYYYPTGQLVRTFNSLD